MSREGERQLDAFPVDVRELLERSVANLYSHLVTRPTGRAVRMAIERQLDQLSGPALSLVDLSSVSVLDYSCADEVVAKLLTRFAREDVAHETFFVFRGIKVHHREPIEAVLERHGLAAVAETSPERFELLGMTDSEHERTLWNRLERSGTVPADQVGRLVEGGELREGLERLLSRRLLFRHPLRGDLHALSTLIHPPR